MAQSLSQLYTHIVFHIDFTAPVRIPNGLQTNLHAYLAKACHNQESPSIIVGGIDDHIHILCRISKNIAPANLLEEIKTSSSAWVKTQANKYGYMLSRFSWQKGYGIFSVSSSQVDKVKQYILNQKKHHSKIPFKEEYINLLRKHNIDYDEKYLWN